MLKDRRQTTRRFLCCWPLVYLFSKAGSIILKVGSFSLQQAVVHHHRRSSITSSPLQLSRLMITTSRSNHHRLQLVQKQQRQRRRRKQQFKNDNKIRLYMNENEHDYSNNKDKNNTLTTTTTTTTTTNKVHLIFPGGGIFFYWQAGAVMYLREHNYDLSQTTMTGASAGALTATLTATNVDFVNATKLALRLAEDGGVWDRDKRKGGGGFGLQGVWGDMIEIWLDELLPDNAIDLVNERLSLLVTPIPSFGKTKISHFHSKQDLIECNMASVHLPWFLNNKLVTDYRGSPHIDGSFLAKPKDYEPPTTRKEDDEGGEEEGTTTTITLDWSQDPTMSNNANEFVKLVSKDGIWNMIETGKRYAAIMEERGDFKSLPKNENQNQSITTNNNNK